jgi:uncharacterized membrane protein
MAPFIVLLFSYLLLYLINRYGLKRKFTTDLIGRTALAFMLVFTGSSHFFMEDQMVQMLPDFLPGKYMIVYLTGVIEFIAAVGLLVKKTSRLASVMLILFFVSVLPANIIGSLNRVELGGMENGTGYLLFRIPLQLFFIGWVYYFGIRTNVNWPGKPVMP